MTPQPHNPASHLVSCSYLSSERTSFGSKFEVAYVRPITASVGLQDLKKVFCRDHSRFPRSRAEYDVNEF